MTTTLAKKAQNRRLKDTTLTPGMPQLVTTGQAAMILGTDEPTLRMARATGTSVYSQLAWIKMGDSQQAPVRYELEELKRWIAKHRRSHRPEASPERTAAE